MYAKEAASSKQQSRKRAKIGKLTKHKENRHKHITCTKQKANYQKKRKPTSNMRKINKFKESQQHVETQTNKYIKTIRMHKEH